MKRRDAVPANFPYPALRRTALIVAAAVLASCSGEAEKPAPTPPAVDLRHLVAQITSIHPDPFHHLARPEFEARVTDDPKEPDRLLVAAMRLANLGTGEGHGGIYPWVQRGLEAWPFHLYDFDADGLRLVAGTGVPIGSRLVAVGETPIEQVVDRVRPLVPHDNEATVRSRLPAYLAFPAVLRGLGIEPSTLTWHLPDGGGAVTGPPPATVPAAEFGSLLGLFQAQVPPSLPYDRERTFWWERRGSALYVRWNQVVRGNDVAPLAAQFKAGGITRVVVDARHNPGGDISAARDLVDAVKEMEGVQPGVVRFLVGRATFSAASHVIAGLMAETDVVLVGEPTGGSAESYADPVPVHLPGSGLLAYVDSRLYKSGAGGWGPLMPDRPVSLSWADWAAGRDPAYEAALR